MKGKKKVGELGKMAMGLQGEKNLEKKMGDKKFGWGSRPTIWRKWEETKRKWRE